MPFKVGHEKYSCGHLNQHNTLKSMFFHLTIVLFTGKPLLNYSYYMLLWPDRPAVLKFISGFALSKVKVLHLIGLELSFY